MHAETSRRVFQTAPVAVLALAACAGTPASETSPSIADRFEFSPQQDGKVNVTGFFLFGDGEYGGREVVDLAYVKAAKKYCGGEFAEVGDNGCMAHPLNDSDGVPVCISRWIQCEPAQP